MEEDCCCCRYCSSLPQPVNVTKALFLFLQEQPSDNNDSYSDDDDDDDDAQLLAQNLSLHGYSPLIITLPSDDDDDDNGNDIETKESNDELLMMKCLLRRHWQWKSLLQELFAPNVVCFSPATTTTTTTTSLSSLPPVCTYRTRESGAPTAGSLEPKQSWEIRRRRSNKATTTTTTAKEEENSMLFLLEQRLRGWVNLLHAVAVAARTMLGLPPHLLLHEQQQQQDNDDEEESEPMDLLRAFYYDAATTDNNSNAGCNIGSSPHTDWGSFTVIWQDTVWGLQTYCPHCQVWNNVPTSLDYGKKKDNNEENNTVHLILHVGDITSLAMRRRRRQRNDHNQKQQQQQRTWWPSPRHRVLLSSPVPRTSLVYFAYPPRNWSLSQIQEQLGRHSTMISSTTSLSDDDLASADDDEDWYEEYSLLQNQSVTTSSLLESSPNAKQQYERILHQPLWQVLAEKWQQVQRQGDD